MAGGLLALIDRLARVIQRIGDSSGFLSPAEHDLADPASWSSTQRDQLRWAIVAERDKAGVRNAAEMLFELTTIWPDEPVFWLELLVIREMSDPAAPPIDISACPESVKHHPAIALFLSLEASRNGDYGTARVFLGRVNELDDISARAFAGLHRSLVETMILRPALKAMSSSDLEEMQTAARNEAVVAMSDLIRIADKTNDLREFARAAGFFNVYEIDQPIAILSEAFDKASSQLSSSGMGVYIGLLTALRLDDQALAVARELLDRKAFSLSAETLRAVALLAARSGDFALEHRALRRAQQEPQGSAIRQTELAMRARALGLDRPMRVFIGMFGQMREPEFTIPALVEHFQRDFPTTEAELRFGLATWPQSGFRPLSLDDSAGFFQQAVPPSLRPLLSEQNGTNGHRLKQAWPKLVDAMMNWSASQQPQTPDITKLEALLPAGSKVVRGDEVEIRQRAEQTPSMSRDFSLSQINQLKMWSRISALGSITEDFEKQEQTKFDCCILVRCDLTSLHGSLYPLASKAASAVSRSTVFHDYDAHAEFIEGSGDRYIVSSRSAADILFSGFEYYFQALENLEGSPLAERVVCHEGVQSLLFVNGLTPEPVWAMGYEIHRPPVPSAILESALMKELEECRHEDRRRDLMAALETLGAD